MCDCPCHGSAGSKWQGFILPVQGTDSFPLVVCVHAFVQLYATSRFFPGDIGVLTATCSGLSMRCSSTPVRWHLAKTALWKRCHLYITSVCCTE